jgi:GNAT superfamily N-acetyltransferase
VQRAPLSAAEPLAATHDVTTFDCGTPELTDWLRRYALVNQQNRSARVFVVHRARHMVGYYALAAASVDRIDAPPRVSQGLANHPIPVILLARLAVALSEQRQGLGRALLKDALLRSLRASNEIGARAVLVHAQDEEARRFYERFDFEASPTDPSHLFLLMKDVTQAAG